MKYLLILLITFVFTMPLAAQDVCGPDQKPVTFTKCVPAQVQPHHNPKIKINYTPQPIQEKKNMFLFSLQAYGIKSIEYHALVYAPGANITYLRKINEHMFLGPGVTYARFIYPKGFQNMKYYYLGNSVGYTHFTYPRGFDMFGFNVTVAILF
jgi:hypothetical protein